MAKVGFLGAGNMGIGIASRLINAGHELHIYNRTQSKLAPLVERGAIAASTAREAAEGADVVFAMVGDDAASKAVWLGEQGALAANPPLIIECSTLSHSWVMELSKLASDQGAPYLDCPVTGLPEAAAAGTLTLFLGGSNHVIEMAQSYLPAISAAQIHFGGIGAGTAYKLIVNLMGSIQIAATAEALLVAERAGLDANLVAEALGTGAAGSLQVVNNSKRMVGGEHEANVLFSTNWRLKDTRYGVDFAKELGQESALGLVAQSLFQQVVDAGFEGAAESKLIDVLRVKKVE